jgi:hypothetical protein
MKRAIIAAVTVAFVTLIAIEAKTTAAPCARERFQTALIKKACETGGQLGALDTMSGFVAKANELTGDGISCNTCHTRVGGDFPLEPDALAKFHAYSARLAAKK